MADVLTTRLDPVDGLVNYTLFTKPYHTKILEVLVEYIHTDCVDITMTEGFWLSLGMPASNLLELWGWSLDEAQRYFNCNWQTFQICTVSPSGGYFDVVGDYQSLISPGDELLLQSDMLQFSTYNVSGVMTTTTPLTTVVEQCTTGGSPPPDCQSYMDVDCDWVAGSPLGRPSREGRVVQCREDFRFTGNEPKTRIFVTETIPPLQTTNVVSAGSIVRSSGGSPPVPIQSYYWGLEGQVTEFQAGDIFAVTGDTGIPGAFYGVVTTEYDNASGQTRIFVSADLSAAVGDGVATPAIKRTGGVLFPSSCWTYVENSGVYQFKTGIAWPPMACVEQTINCGGYGYIWDSVGTGSPPTGPLTSSVPIIGGSSTFGYFDIDNTFDVPASASTWEEVLKYGVNFQVSGSTGNDAVYTVFQSAIVYSGSPLAATNTLRVYVAGNIPSNVMDGGLQVIGWGYSEPTLCVDQGGSMAAYTGIYENMQLTINDNGAKIVQGWDMQGWDIAGFDGGAFTYTIVFT